MPSEGSTAFTGRLHLCGPVCASRGVVANSSGGSHTPPHVESAAMSTPTDGSTTDRDRCIRQYCGIPEASVLEKILQLPLHLTNSGLQPPWTAASLPSKL